MKVSSERYFPRLENTPLAPFEPFISYEHWHRYRYTVPYITGKTVLDIASGEGYGSALLAAHASLVYGVDVSNEAVQHARRNYDRENLYFLQGAADRIPIPGQHCFDVIVSFETIEHLDEPAQARFAQEVKRLLKPDGIFLISTPDRASYTDSKPQKNPYHYHEFTREEFDRFLHENFQDVHLMSQHVYPVSYIWNLSGPSGPIAEYQMSLEEGVFRPVEGDGKETGYLIAVCSDRGGLEVGPDSLLVDLTEVAFRGIPGRDRWQSTMLFIDTGDGFRGEEMIREQVDYGPDFAVTFSLDPAMSVRQLRWDPLEMLFCNIRLHEVIWQDDKGSTCQLDLDGVTSNGERRDEAGFQLETLDPMIFLPISGRVASVTIRGECLVESEVNSLIGLERVARSHLQRLAERDRELQLTRGQLVERDGELQQSREQLEAQRQSAEALRQQQEQQFVQQLAERDGDLQQSRERLEAQRRSAEALRQQQEQQFVQQLVERDGDLQQSRERLEAQRQSAEAHRQSAEGYRQQLQVLTEHLQDREEIMSELEDTLRQLEVAHQSILNSKRWRLSNQVRSTIYFIPSRLTTLSCSLRRRLRRIASRLKPQDDGDRLEVDDDDEKRGRSAA